MNSLYFRLPPEQIHLSEINAKPICTNTKFKFDQEITCQDDDIFELKNGQLFLIRHDIRTIIDGKWETTPNN